MKKYLITLLIIPTLIFADAVIFSGSDVKTLKPNIDLFGVAKILTTSTIPTAGLTAPIGSIAMYLTTGDLYLKTGALNTDWTKNQTGPVNLTTDVTGILPITNGGTGSATQNFVDLTTAQSIAGLKNFTDALTITSNSANSLAVGPNGTTNSVLQIDSSTASSATGVKVTGAAAGSGVAIAAISSGSNEDLTLGSKGTGTTSIQVNGISKYTASQQQNVFTTSASSIAANTKFLVTGSADSALTASTEALGVHFDLAQARQHATGTLAAQRDVRISPSTHSFVGASALTLAAALSIDGPPLGGTNATIASTTALRVTGGTTSGATNAYGVMIAAPNGATNNYAGIFTGGNVGIGTVAPGALLDVSGTATASRISSTKNGTWTAGEVVGELDFYSADTSAGGTGVKGAVKLVSNDTTGARTDLTLHASSNGTNGVELMRLVGDTGFVGVGTTAPTSKVDVVAEGTSGVIAVTGYGTSSAGFFNGRAARGTLAAPTASQIYDNLGGLNIGGYGATAFGSSRLSIRGFAAENWTDTAQGTYWSFLTTPTGTASAAEVMRLNSSGNLGLGTTNPLVRLDIVGTAANQFRISDTTADATQKLSYITGRHYTNAQADVLHFLGTNGVSSNTVSYGGGSGSLNSVTEHRFYTGATNTTPTGTQRMTINSAGNIGIGVTSPNANAILDVTSTTKAFMPPRMTTAQKNAVASPTAGMVVYDTDMKGISFYNGTAWTTTNNKNVATKTANYTALQSDDVLLGDATSGAITITLPTAVGNTGEVFHIKKIDSSVNAVTIATTSSQTIDGALTQPILFQYQTITIVSNGVGWSVL